MTISHGSQSFTGSWKRAIGVAAAWGVKLVADPPADDTAKDGGKGKDAGATVKRFNAGRRVS